MKRNQRNVIEQLVNWKKTLLIALVFATPVTIAFAGPGGTDRPHAGMCDTVVTPLTQGFPLLLRIDLACQFRHLGLTTGVIAQEVNATGPVVNNLLPAAVSSQITYTAANGDALRSTFLGVASINVVTGAVAFEGIETYGGGTGRFSQASGSSFLEGTVPAGTNNGFYTTVGRISY
jgi:hypothetical protein